MLVLKRRFDLILGPSGVIFVGAQHRFTVCPMRVQVLSLEIQTGSNVIYRLTGTMKMSIDHLYVYKPSEKTIPWEDSGCIYSQSAGRR
jgi:hypothetical protein